MRALPMVTEIRGFRWGLAAIVWCLLSFSSWSAEFSKTPISDNGVDIIGIVGDLEFGDERKFINLALSSRNALVVFQSPGGNVFAAIEIGKAIHLKGFSTLVPDGLQCASACALAWLGGRTRYISDTGRVGFHAAYTNKDGQPAISSAANAVIGAYLNQLRLSASAIVYITSSPPEGMQWLNLADARRFGIDVQPVDQPTKANTEPAAPTAPSRSPQQSTGDTASSFYHSRYRLAGFLARAAYVCETLDGKRTVEAGVRTAGNTPELRAVSSLSQNNRSMDGGRSGNLQSRSND